MTLRSLRLGLAVLPLLPLAGCTGHTHDLFIVPDSTDPHGVAVHHIAKAGDTLNFMVDGAQAYRIHFDDPQACASKEHLLHDRDVLLACPGQPATCNLSGLSKEQGYDVAPATAAEQQACGPEKGVHPFVNFIGDHCNGCIVSAPPGH